MRGAVARRLAAIGASDNNGNSDSISGWGFNGRLGYTFTSGSVHSFNASFEVSPCFYEENGASGRITNIALIIGYQHL